ncbi:hypothetical protein VTO42DRAFT_3758 [Malbranchea cinnamomea]
MAMLLWNLAGTLLVLMTGMAWYRKLYNARPSLPPEEADLDQMAPYPDTKIKGTPKHHITMGLRTLDRQNWLTVDRGYKEQHQTRMELLHKKRSIVVQCLPKAEEACNEALHQVTEFLCNRYPAIFKTENTVAGPVIENKGTHETFFVGKFTNGMSPLAVASILTMEDLTILLQTKEGDHYIGAPASYAPIGWSADRAMGLIVSKMHGPVPQWQERPENAVNKYLPFHTLFPR